MLVINDLVVLVTILRYILLTVFLRTALKVVTFEVFYAGYVKFGVDLPYLVLFVTHHVLVDLVVIISRFSRIIRSIRGVCSLNDAAAVTLLDTLLVLVLLC